jgi:hypothetical protein
MVKKEKEYRRLPGKGFKKGSLISLHRIRASLYAGKDHLLCVYNSVYEEEYRRYYYKDIQAFVLRKTPRRDIWALVFFLPALYFLYLFVFGDQETPWRIFYGSGLAFFSGLLAINLFRGTTADCYLQTATSREPLPTFGRLKNAKKSIAIIKPLILNAQGEMTTSEIAEKAKILALEPKTGDVEPTGANLQKVSDYHGKFHLIFYSLLTANGFISALHIIFHPVWVSLIESLLAVTLMVFLIISLVRQSDSLLPRSVRILTWWALGFEAIVYIHGVILSQIYIMETKVMFVQMFDLFRWVSSLSPQENAIFFGYLIFSSLASFLLAGMGFLFLSLFRSRKPLSNDFSGSKQRLAQTTPASGK